ncbi:hypothetical protein [Kitasatospora sp. NBC_00315]|uniref:hypothetical protein n=1 Tax=Kitasatospora sp. NBC_00315 TaxID=2975963 RepID=UPI00324D392B
MGVLQKAAVTTVIAGVLLGGYELSPLSDPQVPTAQMRADADHLDDVLQQNLYRFNNTGDDRRFELAGAGTGGVALLDVRQQHSATDRTVEVDYLFGGAVPRSVLDWGPGKGVQSCYRYTFTNMLYTLRHRLISCPKDLPPPPQPGARAAGGDASPAATAVPDGVLSAQRHTEDLADRIRKATRPAPALLQPDTALLTGLLTTAQIDPAVPRALTTHSGVALLALGTAHHCVLAAVDTHAVNVWAAPFEAPCTTDRAYQSYAMAYWPPLPGM